MTGRWFRLLVTLASVALGGCERERTCGPTQALVARAIDGDTLVLETGEIVRYLMVDTPESTGEVECYGPEAAAFNRALIEERRVDLRYDRQCTDRFGRLLAYVLIDHRDVNRLLVERGYGCMLHIPPDGDDRVEEFGDLEEEARAEGRGLWGYCAAKPPRCTKAR